MTKKAKLLQKLHKIPPPKDFAWDDLVTLMRQWGFTEDCVGGSHYTFEHATGLRISMSKTHPSGVLKRYQIDAAKSAIAACKAPEEEDDE